MNESISVIDSVEILPLGESEISPLLTKVKVKVFHLGENRNRSFIDRETAVSMAKTLRGNPIVARYREEKGDFTDHGNEIIINDKGIQSKSMTKPYGFVDLNAKVWFEDYIDVNELGEQIVHTYLVTEGMIWTEQFEELKNTVLQDGERPQSMELDEKRLNGFWSNSINPKYEIFIINDAIISKLCMLGEDVEPCFPGANVSVEFNKYNEESFVKELLELKNKFQYALNNEKGGLSMEDLNVTTPVVEEAVAAVEETPAVETPVENFSNEEGNTVETVIAENENTIGEFEKKEDEKEKNSESETSEEPEQGKEEDDEEKKKNVAQNTCNEEDESKKKYELLETEFEELKTRFASLEEENKKLLAFKQEVEDKQKDEMIESFYMLSDEDKKDVIANKANYSLDDIKAKLSIICVDKRVDFNLGRENSKEENKVEAAPITYNLDSHEASTLPAWLQAVETTRNRIK